MPDGSGAVDLSAPKASEEPTQDQAAEQPGKPDFLYAYTVVATLDGQVTYQAYDGKSTTARHPSQDEVYASAAVIQKDLLAYETASASVNLQQQVAAQMAERMRAQQIAQGLDLSGGR